MFQTFPNGGVSIGFFFKFRNIGKCKVKPGGAGGDCC